MKLGEAMYKAQQQQAGAGGGEAAEGAGGAKPDENVVDAEFTEVDEKKKGAA
jgi:molecular chaperone DnaK